MMLRPIPDDVVTWRMNTLAAHGVPEKDRRAVAIAQLETERAQAMAMREMSEGRDDDGADMMRAKYDGVDPRISAAFEDDQFELHRCDKHGSSSKSRSRKRRRPKPADGPFGYGEAS